MTSLSIAANAGYCALDRWIPYPFQNNIRYLPNEACYECLAGLIDAHARRDHSDARDFSSFIDAVFGDGIVKHFMGPYNFKVWAHPGNLMSTEWVGERVAVVDTARTEKCRSRP